MSTYFNRFFGTAALVAGSLAACSPVYGDALPSAAVRSAGLEIHWQTTIEADVSRDEIADMFLHVHDTRADSWYEVRYSGIRETIAFDDVGPRGIPFGEEGAREFAELRREILEAEGHTDVTVELVNAPQTTIYALAGFGDVHAIDAETGRTRWKTRVGLPDQPAGGIAANNEHVVVLKGSRVYCLRSENGHLVWSRLTREAPAGGVSISGNFAYVTSVRGDLQMFPLNERGLPEKFFASSGPSTDDPTVTSRTVSWSTLRGYYNVASSDPSGELLYRLQTSDRFLAAGAQAGEFLIAPTVHGKVFALNEMDGAIAWELAVGEPVSQKPVYVGDNRVALISTLNNLMMLDVRRGELVGDWPRAVPNIREYVGASQNVLYFLDTSNRLVGLRRDSGSQVVQADIGDKIRVLRNFETDRMYLCDDRGGLVCLREVANVNPVLFGDEEPAPEAAADAQPATPEPQETAVDPNDPFATPPASDDPFAQPGEPAPAQDDPFAQPGGGDEGQMDPDDPFADPGQGDEPAEGGDDPDNPFDDPAGDDPAGDDPGGDDPADDGGDQPSGDDPFAPDDPGGDDPGSGDGGDGGNDGSNDPPGGGR
jgi:outer membrane protein assembly factor BamB